MKRIVIVFTLITLTLGLCACGGNVTEVNVIDCDSDQYTQEDIQNAITVAEQYFEQEFAGCTLTEISYAGDELCQDYASLAEQYDADEVIVLVSDFYVSSGIGDGSLASDNSYDDWCWVLARKHGGSWKHVEHGYC